MVHRACLEKRLRPRHYALMGPSNQMEVISSNVRDISGRSDHQRKT